VGLETRHQQLAVDEVAKRSSQISLGVAWLAAAAANTNALMLNPLADYIAFNWSINPFFHITKVQLFKGKLPAQPLHLVRAAPPALNHHLPHILAILEATSKEK
jgi:hypothetical protein